MQYYPGRWICPVNFLNTSSSHSSTVTCGSKTTERTLRKGYQVLPKMKLQWLTPLNCTSGPLVWFSGSPSQNTKWTFVPLGTSINLLYSGTSMIQLFSCYLVLSFSLRKVPNAYYIPHKGLLLLHVSYTHYQ